MTEPSQTTPKLDIAAILKMTPQSLAQYKHDVMKEHVIERLKKVIDLIEKEDYDSLYADDLVEHSESGDSYTPGDSNYYINLSYEKDSSLDISQAVDMLERFKKEAGVSTK